MSTSKTHKRHPARLWIVIGAVVAALALVVVIIVATLPKGASPAAVAERFLQAVATSDGQALSVLVDEAEGDVATAVKYAAAISTPISGIEVDEAGDWGPAADGIAETNVPYSFVLNGEIITGVLSVSRTDEGERVTGASTLVGVVALPDIEGVHAGVKGAEEAGSSVALFPGAYEMTKPELPFPFFIAEDEVVVIPGASVTVAPHKDDAKVEQLISSLTAGAEEAAAKAAQGALSAGSLSLEGLQVGSHAGRNVHYAELTDYLPPSYADGQVAFRYLATFDGDKWIGALSQEWITMQNQAKVTVTYPIDSSGAASTATTSVDTSESAWWLPN